MAIRGPLGEGRGLWLVVQGDLDDTQDQLRFYNRAVRGVLSVENTNGLLAKFLLNAPSVVRAHAITVAGRSLTGADVLPPGVVPRFVALWEWFWAEFVEGREDPVTEELAAFGWWMSCGKFSDEWCLKHLLRITEMQPTVQLDDDIIGRLAELARDHPLETVTCADKLVRGHKEGWRIYGWGEALTSLLQNVLDSKSSDSGTIAKQLIEHLGRRGFVEYGKLISGE